MAEQGEARSFTSDDATDTALAIAASLSFSLTLSHFLFLSPHSIRGFCEEKKHGGRPQSRSRRDGNGAENPRTPSGPRLVLAIKKKSPPPTVLK